MGPHQASYPTHRVSLKARGSRTEGRKERINSYYHHVPSPSIVTFSLQLLLNEAPKRPPSIPTMLLLNVIWRWKKKPPPFPSSPSKTLLSQKTWYLGTCCFCLMSDMDLAVKTEELELFLFWPRRTSPCETELSECLQLRCSLLMEGTFWRMTTVHTQVRDEI